MAIFKTLLVEPNVFGVLSINNGTILVGVSQRPELYGEEVTIEILSDYFSKFRVIGLDRNFDWSIDVPKDWKLVDVEVNVIEVPKKSSSFVEEWFAKFGEWEKVGEEEGKELYLKIVTEAIEPFEENESLHVWEQKFHVGKDVVKLIGAIGSSEFEIEKMIKKDE
jgi:hypothetical protein